MNPLTDREDEALIEPNIDLQRRVDKATENTERGFLEAMKEIADLKRKINDIEARVSQKADADASQDLNELNSIKDSLDKLTDTAILRSKTAWQEYEKLEHDCREQALDTARLDDLKNLCKKTEQLAADLLCYSLASFKQKTL